MSTTPSKKFSQIAEPWNDPSSEPYVLIDGVTLSHDGFTVLNKVNLSVYKNELFSLLGPSGCGKTTILRILAGFEKPESGIVYIDGVNMNNIPAYDRPVSMVFQSYALFPHMTVEDNVMFGLKQNKITEDEMKEIMLESLELVQMTHYMHRYPHQLSGGQKQRVALARSIAKKPKLLLLDEPLAALDKQLREKTQLELVNIQEKVGITFIMVSHDQEEAMTMSTRIGVMNDGKIMQTGTPKEIYEYPNSRYVAEFVGNANIFDGVVVEEVDDYSVIHSFGIDRPIYAKRSTSAPVGSHVYVAMRPEKIIISKNIDIKLDNNCAFGFVKDIAYLGDVSIYHVDVGRGITILCTTPNFLRIAEQPIQWDDEVVLYWYPENCVIMTM